MAKPYLMTCHSRVWHGMYVLADFPVLAALARERTGAARLDGRACFSIYMDAFERIDRQALSPHELAFMESLEVPAARVSC